jgi:uncharacterized phage infection (PIP) family protein YhgE
MARCGNTKMNKVTRKKRTASRTSVTAVTLQHINEKLNHIHKDLEQNTKDIAQLKDQVAMGRGGLKVIFYVGGVISIIIGVLKIGKII